MECAGYRRLTRRDGDGSEKHLRGNYSAERPLGLLRDKSQ